MKISRTLARTAGMLAMWGSLVLPFFAQATELNLANQAELEMVKGIGPQLSGRILAERELGRFASWDDFIARMKGIGPSHAARLSAAGLRVSGAAYAADQAASGAAPPRPAK